ncbi:hypothetical protein MLD38_007550 [Melastoma candidum]|uniref:Uncharacterized protein n=1 Tax=Melastoma candidum TaxID=119954 RepID=A0ACB9RQN5_9MYRT|nr:hypothetical protein MLD38_007550 [Melastoma candidum]
MLSQLLPIFFFFFSFFFLLNFKPTASSPIAPSPHPSNNTQFILTSCSSTLYPDLCSSSLLHYADAVSSDPARLARVSIAVSLSRASHTAAYVSGLSRQADYGSDQRASSALHDCFTNFGDAVDEMRGSLKQMRQLGTTGESFRFGMSNVQTWMSAALTNEESCTDGFEDVADGRVKKEVCEKAEAVKMVTSNALALVNRFVNAVASGTP